MAKIGCLKPFRGIYDSIKDIVLEDGEIAFTTDNKRIYMGDGTNVISNLTPYINNGTTDISNIGDGSITGAINTINSKIKNVRLVKRTDSGPISDNLLEIASYYDNLSDSEKRRAFINVAGFGEAYVYSPGAFFTIMQTMSLFSVTIYTISGNAIQSNMNSDGTNRFYDYRGQIAAIELYV